MSYFTFYIFAKTEFVAFVFPNILSSYLISVSSNKSDDIITQPGFRLSFGYQNLIGVLSI